jgi:hypothetical protein
MTKTKATPLNNKATIPISMIAQKSHASTDFIRRSNLVPAINPTKTPMITIINIGIQPGMGIGLMDVHINVYPLGRNGAFLF